MIVDIIVIGGGFAGLSAATAAAEQGARVLVLEARPTLGGRATAFTDPATGERVDNGQHVIIGGYHETFAFLRRLGTDAAIHLQRDLSVDFVDRNGRPSRFRCPPLPSPLHLLAGGLQWSALAWKDRMAMLRMRRPIRGALGRGPAGAGGAGSQEVTVREWLVLHGQTPRLIEMLWEPLAVAALNQSVDSAAAAPFLEVLTRMFAGGRRDAALGLPRVRLDELYTLPARQFIEERGGTVRVNATARVSVDSSGANALRGGPESSPRYSVVVRGQTVQAPVVVCAVAWHSLPDVFPDPPPALVPVLDAARATAASPIVTVNLWLDRVVTSATFIGLPGRTMQWVFDKRLLFGESASHLSLVSSGAEAVVSLSNQELIDLALTELRQAIPPARSAAVRRAVVVRERRATFSVAPGQPPRPSTVTELPGLFLAGDWIDTALPATIEGAVASGHWAAAAALNVLPRRPRTDLTSS